MIRSMRAYSGCSVLVKIVADIWRHACENDDRFVCTAPFLDCHIGRPGAARCYEQVDIVVNEVLSDFWKRIVSSGIVDINGRGGCTVRLESICKYLDIFLSSLLRAAMHNSNCCHDETPPCQLAELMS